MKSLSPLLGTVFLLAALSRVSGLEPGGTISGTVFSPVGTRLPGVLVTLTHEETGVVYRVTTGDKGLYRARDLPVGRYRLLTELTGFLSEVISDIVIREGESKSVDVVLRLALTVNETITVIGNAPRESVEGSEIREMPARDVGEALSDSPGVWKVRKGGTAHDVVLRGLQSRDLNVLIDGQRVHGACPNTMDPPASHVDFSEVDRVDVSKGPFDMKNYGSLGGTINIVTRRPERGWHASGDLALGSFRFINPSGTVSYASSTFSALGGYSYRSSDAYKDGSSRRFTEIANYRPEAVDGKAFEVGTPWGKLGWVPTGGHQLLFSYARQDVNQVYYPYLLMDAVYDDTDRLSFRYDGRDLSSRLRALTGQAYFTRVAHWMTDEYRSSAVGPRGYSMGTMAHSQTIGGKVELEIGSFAVGFEAFERFWGATTEMARMAYRPQFSLPDVTVSSLGGYAEYTRPLSERVSLNAGARLDRVRSTADETKANTALYYAYHGVRDTSATDTFPSGKLRLTYVTSPGIELAVGVGHTVQVPEPSERYLALMRMDNDWVGNPQIPPSRNTGLDLSGSLDRPGLHCSAAGFVNWVGDFVAVYDQPRVNATPGAKSTQARSYANVDARLWGGEVSAVVSLEDRLFLSGDLSYVRGTKRGAPEKNIFSENVAEIPPLRSHLGLRFDMGSLFWALEGLVSAPQKSVDTDLKEQETPGYAVVDVRLGARFGRLSLNVGVGNVFDKMFVEHLSYQRDPFRSGVRVPEPGRNLFFDLACRF